MHLLLLKQTEPRGQAVRVWDLLSLCMPKNYTDDEEEVLTSNEEVSQKLDAVVKAMTDLSRHVEATEECQKEGGASPSSSSSTSHHRRRARHQETPEQTQDVTEEVRWCIAKRLREQSVAHEATKDKDRTSDEEVQQVHRRKKKGLKSGMNQTGASTVVRKVTKVLAS